MVNKAELMGRILNLVRRAPAPMGRNGRMRALLAKAGSTSPNTSLQQTRQRTPK